MPNNPVSMRKLKEILRLKYGSQLSHRAIAKSLSISPSVVSRYANRAAQMGIMKWPLDDKWSDAELEAAFLKTKVKLKKCNVPDWSQVHVELKNKTLTLQLLWEEYRERHPDAYYSYNHYCRMYRQWLGKQKPSMRQLHRAGEKLFVDYCGPTVEIIDRATGEILKAQIFVAVMGASNYTYAEATRSQGLEDWVMSHARCFEFLGGVPELVIPDNLKSAVSKPCKYEPDLNPTYQQMAAFYDTAVLPARPYKPKDKAKAEVAVQIVERWILARLRHQQFYSLAGLNSAIAELLDELNNTPFKKLPGTRQSQFQDIDKPALKPLPAQPYQYTQVKKVRVHPDYHVEVARHYYSVPHQYIGKQLEAHISGQLVALFYQGNQLTAHPRSHRQGGHTTTEAHMPEGHQKQQWSAERFERWADKIGSYTLQMTRFYLQRKSHPAQGFRACMGLLSLSAQYSNERLEAACHRASLTGISHLSGIKSMLKAGLDQQPLPQKQPDLLADIDHANIRGNHYYH